ncbi:MAG: hypothetical protein M3176_17775 [Chloroflexota bacterium]|nr:hypothetical protein [Chloroflexota bacterium]MDQ6908676.1 hypothetical protein [Chloroflexota bacterium]
MASKRAALFVLVEGVLLVACGGNSLAVPSPTAIATVAPTATTAPPTAAPATATTIAPTATNPPTATRPPATATSAPAATARTQTAGTGTTGTASAQGSATAVSREPRGAIPAGWSVYRGTRLPFAIAYPPDWSVDASGIESGRIVFRSPGNAVIETTISTTGKADPTANIDVLREQDNKAQAQTCRQSGISFTRYNAYSGLTFATVGANCDVVAGLSFYWIGVGLKEQVPWRFRVTAPKDLYNQSTQTIINPMMSSLNIYANP